MKHQPTISDVPFLWASQHPLLSQGGQRLHLGDFIFQDPPKKHTALAKKTTTSENGCSGNGQFLWVCWGFMLNFSGNMGTIFMKHQNDSECETIDYEDAATTTCLEKRWHPWHPLIPVLLCCSAQTDWVQILQHSCQSDTILSMSPIDHPIYEDSWHICSYSKLCTAKYSKPLTLDHQYSIDWSHRSQLHDLPLHMVSSSMELNLFQNDPISWNSRSKALDHFGIILSLNPSFSNSASLCESGVFRKISREPCRADQRCNVGKHGQHHSGHHIRYPGNLGSLLNGQKSGKYKLFSYY